jgi:hypothetical protein
MSKLRYSKMFRCEISLSWYQDPEKMLFPYSFLKLVEAGLSKDLHLSTKLHRVTFG